VLIERDVFPRAAPGETLHPGVIPLLRRLGLEDQVLAAGFLRHEGHFVRWDGPTRFVSFGRDESGPWLGLQAWRPVFDHLLLLRARQLGVSIRQPCRVLRAFREANRITGVLTGEGFVRAAFVVDATGRRHWLAKQLGLAIKRHGPRSLAWYGYVEGDCPIRDDAPALVADARGWTWTARVRPGIYQWTRLSFDNQRPAASWLPQELEGLKRCSRTTGVDTSWRAVQAAAGPGYFLTGDAAAVLDPASSHGVLRALMTGMMTGHLLGQVVAHGLPEEQAAVAYREWLRDWFAHDVRRLKEQYAALPDPPQWV
jgi:flavin-dependent dehydrogenase